MKEMIVFFCGASTTLATGILLGIPRQPSPTLRVGSSCGRLLTFGVLCRCVCIYTASSA